MMKVLNQIKNYLTNENNETTVTNIIVALLLMVEKMGFTTFIKSCSDAPLNIYICMYLSAMFFCTVQNLYFTYYDNWDKINKRHIKWSSATIFVTFLYFMIGNTFASAIIGAYLGTCKYIMFKGQDGNCMTWEELRELIKNVRTKARPIIKKIFKIA